jgi:hypothetical protein
VTLARFIDFSDAFDHLHLLVNLGRFLFGARTGPWETTFPGVCSNTKWVASVCAESQDTPGAQSRVERQSLHSLGGGLFASGVSHPHTHMAHTHTHTHTHTHIHTHPHTHTHTHTHTHIHTHAHTHTHTHTHRERHTRTSGMRHCRTTPKMLLSTRLRVVC